MKGKARAQPILGWKQEDTTAFLGCQPHDERLPIDHTAGSGHNSEGWWSLTPLFFYAIHWLGTAPLQVMTPKDLV